MNHMDYPYRIDLNARTAQTTGDEYIRDLIEQVLFTSPGERVNRPTFGSGLLQLIFAGQEDELSLATQSLVQGALQQWLGDLIQVDAIHVESMESQINVTIQYTVRRSQRRETARFTREV
jgi:phage baseplate assembly protein W